MIKAIVFDLDGVLVDAADWHYRALNRSLNLFGFSISEKEHLKEYNGLSTQLKLDLLTKKNNLPEALHSFLNEQKQNFTKDIIEEYCEYNSIIIEMLQKLKQDGFKLALATNSLRNTLDSILYKMQIGEFFDVILCQDDVRKVKPHPQIYLNILKQLKVNPWECLVVEDSFPGIQSAKAASLRVLEVFNQKQVNYHFVKERVDHLNQQQENAPVIEIVIPMAGMGSRFQAAGYKNPKPFIDVMGKPMIEWVIDNVKPTQYKSHFTFICHEEHLKSFPVEQILKSKLPDASIVTVKNTTEGAACTVLLAIEYLKHGRPLLLANSDQWVDVKVDDFLKQAIDSDVDGSIMTFEASDKKWSFARIDSSGRVTQVAEKNPISNHATVGIYYFKRAQDFVNGALEMIRKNIRTNGEFYVCPVYNELIAEKKNIHIFEIEPWKMNGLGTPEDLEAFLTKTRMPSFEAILPHSLPSSPRKTA